MTPESLAQELAKVVDISFAREAISAYIEIEQRFIAGDWSPAGLNGGRLCEAVARGIYQLDTGQVNHSLNPGGVTDYLIRQKNASHLLDTSDRVGISRAIDSIYKIRSDRGFVHISPKHDANYMDSMFVLHGAKWILSEFLRIAWTSDKQVIGEVIASIAQMETALVHEMDGEPLVLASSMTVAEEVLILLNHASQNRLSRSDIGKYASGRSSGSISTALSRLMDAREIRPVGKSEYALTPTGQKRVREIIIPKLVNR